MSIENKIEEASRQKFAGLTSAELREYGKTLGATFGPNTSDETMRHKLCEMVGQLPAEGISMSPRTDAPVSSIRSRSPFDPKPNLSPGANAWGGRKHSLTVNAPSDNMDTPKTHLTVSWEGETRWWSYDVPIIMPEPYYNIFKDCRKTEVSTVNRMDAGDVVGTDVKERKFNRYSFQYHGVVPGTEDLPTSLADYWLRQCKKTDGFTAPGVERKHLMEIRSQLYGPTDGNPREFYKNLTNEDILHDIYTFLNFDEYMDEQAVA